MESCCQGKAAALERLRARQSRILKVLLAANAAMFLLEAAFGVVARSTALLGDSLDMLGDALVYGASLHVLDRGLRSKAKAVLLKGGVLTFLGLGVLAEAAFKLARGTRPEALTIGWVGLLALAVNIACLLLLLRHRHHDINMESAWTCSRNDIIANVSVLLAAGAVAVFGSAWPDIAVGVGIAALFLGSAVGMLRSGVGALRRAKTPAQLS
jgi:Co/Zn/Cd efflux system component